MARWDSSQISLPKFLRKSLTRLEIRDPKRYTCVCNCCLSPPRRIFPEVSAFVSIYSEYLSPSMPTLIVETASTGNDDEMPPSSADMLEGITMNETTSSKTPKKSNAGPRKRKVTPGTSTTKKGKSMNEDATTKGDSVKQPIKKQKNLLSFFCKPAPKSTNATQPTTIACNNNKSSSKPATTKSRLDKESLRDIVLGSAVLTPMIHAKNDTPLNYEKHKGSPMPTNFKQPPFGRSSLTSPRERLLDRLNQQSPPTKSSQLKAAPSSSPPAVMSTPQDWFHSDALLEKDDDEKTLCFSQESQEPADLMVVEQPSSYDDGSNHVVPDLPQQLTCTHDTTDEEKTVQEVIVDMTQIDSTQSHDEELAAVYDHEDERVTQVVQECIVDLTQIDSNEDSPTPTVDLNEEQAIGNDINKVIKTKDQHMVPPSETLDTMGPKVDCKPKVAQSTPMAAPAGEEDTHVVPPERLASLEKNQALRRKTMKRMAALLERVANGIEEETIVMPSPSTIQADTFDEELSQQAVVKLAVIVQGRYVLVVSGRFTHFVELLILVFAVTYRFLPLQLRHLVYSRLTLIVLPKRLYRKRSKPILRVKITLPAAPQK